MNESLRGVLVWGAILAGAVAVLGAAIWLLRKRFLSGDAPAEEAAWDLQQLREMRANGQITDAEFERLKQRQLAQYRAMSPGSGKDV